MSVIKYPCSTEFHVEIWVDLEGRAAHPRESVSCWTSYYGVLTVRDKFLVRVRREEGKSEFSHHGRRNLCAEWKSGIGTIGGFEVVS